MKLFHRDPLRINWDAVIGQALVVLGTIGLLALLAYMLVQHLDDLPIVHKDWVTGECVKVDAAPMSGLTCDHLPARYETVWVGR